VPFEIRAPGNRSSATALLLFGAAFALIWAISDTPQVAVVMLPLVPLAIRVAMEKSWIDADDRLHARNVFRTFTAARSEIAKFAVEDVIGGRAARKRVVDAHLLDGSTIRLAATKSFYGKLFAAVPRPGARNEADDVCAELNDWLEAGA
jgi:hypothetical protein